MNPVNIHSPSPYHNTDTFSNAYANYTRAQHIVGHAGSFIPYDPEQIADIISGKRTLWRESSVTYCIRAERDHPFSMNYGNMSSSLKLLFRGINTRKNNAGSAIVRRYVVEYVLALLLCSWNNGILSLNYCITVDLKIIAEVQTVHGYAWTICRGIVIHYII
ncbi:hypothetical protein An07g09500 [Aspergillus niger]|uniref:Uncharacterized protein n=2 Tax=Aspergillus niger TaxID=5061 RepID=A2QPH8_ASPNC|nr:hypothetical protein An07g09500 [Aspergillus niger]CAK39715.1 hypothetical protein An07g09500 [Aspergillus niger]